MPTIDTIKQCCASKRVAKYQDSNPDKIKAFTTTVVELQNLLSFIGAFQTLAPVLNVNAVRFYLGEHETGETCLIMVPVTNFQENGEDDGGADFISGLELTVERATIPIPELDSLCYDFTFPCPNTCPREGWGFPFNEEENTFYDCDHVSC